jgi:type IV pilus secretin PilQ/predicted competence protein
MRSPERRYQSLWLSCLLIVLVTCPAWADVTGQISGVKLEPDKQRIVIESKGKVGEHVARVMAKPNRLILDFKNTGLERVPNRISVVDDAIKGIRVGATESRARLVVDFQDRPVPAFQITREQNRILLVFGKGLPTNGEPPSGEVSGKIGPEVSVPCPRPVASPLGTAPLIKDPSRMADPGHAKAQGPGEGKDTKGWTAGPWEASAASAPKANAEPRRIKMAQSLEMNTPSSSLWNKRSRPGSASDGALPPDSGQKVLASVPSSADAPAPGQMVREVRPPVTPPTPDPRLLVQEVTELKFIQVGHNSRLIVRGGDHLDYRLTNVSPTKVRLDLVNAEIPKVHQKPLKTDLFSTSVEMIVPGSQTIYVQLKDAVPLQVEKQKGVLMLDFPPPRFVMTPEMKEKGAAGISKPGEGDQAAREMLKRGREERKQALEAIKEQEILKSNEMRRKGIESLQKQQEELEKQRTEILKRYRVTPDPQVFQKPVSMDFQGISLKNAFRLLAEQAGINIIVDDKVTGTTTLRLFQVPLGQVIDTILNSHNLDREMVGNVMRIGVGGEIKKLKEERLTEYNLRISEVNKRLDQIAEEIKKKNEESQIALKALEKTAVEAEEPKEDVKSEDIGEAGCIKVGNKDICFYFAQVRLIYQTPKPIVDTLRCMFNLQCAGLAEFNSGSTQGAVKQEERTEAKVAQEREQFKADQAEQGFAPGSPGYERNVSRFDQRQANLQSARAQTATARGVLESARGGGKGDTSGGSGPDVELQQIIANSMIWPDEANRMVFIKDTVERIAQMKKLIYSLDKPEPQVVIEGRLVQAAQSWSRGLGIIWGGRNNQVGPVGGGKSLNGTSPQSRTAYWGMTGVQGAGDANTATGLDTAGDNIPSSFAVNLPGAVTGMGSLVGLGMQFGLWLNQGITELDTRIQMGEHTGQAKTISRPKVTVLNKQKANIKKGTKIPYASVGAAGTQVQFINADLGLDVTPEIFADGRIRMNVKITNNTPDYANTTDAGPPINTREANTIMTVKDGDTAVIGGILTDDTGFSRNGWPGLMNVPIINFLFSNKSTNRTLEELLVFITPVIVKRPPPAS